MKKIFVIILACISMFMTGCGVIIHKNPEETAIIEKDGDQKEKEEDSVALEVVFPIPQLTLPNYPYDISGFPHKSFKNRSPGPVFLMVAY